MKFEDLVANFADTDYLALLGKVEKASEIEWGIYVPGLDAPLTCPSQEAAEEGSTLFVGAHPVSRQVLRTDWGTP